MELFIFKLITLSFFAARGLAQSVASCEAVFFYMGYLHEYSASDGKTTIGGSSCRNEKCSFDEFFENVADEKGGYSGGVQLGDSDKADSALKMSKALTSAGLTKDPKWNLQKLIQGLQKDHEFLDAIMYVSNAAKADAGDGEPHLYDRVSKALNHMQEATQRDEAEDFVKALREEYPDVVWKLEEIPEMEGESVAREVLDAPGTFTDLLDKGKKAIEGVQGVHEKTAKQQGRSYMAPQLARQSITMGGCRVSSSRKRFGDNLMFWELPEKQQL